MYDKNDQNEPNEVNNQLEPEAAAEQAEAPKTPSELKAMKEAIALHTAKAIAALRATRLSLIEAVKKADQDLRDLGIKKERKKRTPKAPAGEPATTPAPKGRKKKGA